MGTQHVRVSDDRRQRRFQFVGKGSHKLFPRFDLLLQLADIFLQRICHPVKIAGELPKLVPADLSGAVGIITRRHFSGRLGQQAYRLRQQGGNKQHDDYSSQ